jgi:hypothetical protein
MATKLIVYNQALRLMGERRLASLSEARSARYHLDDAYDDSLAACLEQGMWNFAMRSVQIDASDSVTPAFGFAYAFTKPDDWVRTYIMSASDRLDPQLLGNQYNDEAGYWYADVDPLYIKYVSNDTTYGGDLSLWPESFTNYVAASLAVTTCPVIRSDAAAKMESLEKKEARAKADARTKDAMNEGPLFPPAGSWTTARSRGSRKPRSVPGGMIF